MSETDMLWNAVQVRDVKLNTAMTERDSARQVARRLLRERDEARKNHESAENDLDDLAVKLHEARQNGIQLREALERVDTELTRIYGVPRRSIRNIILKALGKA